MLLPGARLTHKEGILQNETVAQNDDALLNPNKVISVVGQKGMWSPHHP